MLEAEPLQGGELSVMVKRSLVHGTMLFTLPNVNDCHDDKVHQPLIYPGHKLAMSGTLLRVLAAAICLQKSR